MPDFIPIEICKLPKDEDSMILIHRLTREYEFTTGIEIRDLCNIYGILNDIFEQIGITRIMFDNYLKNPYKLQPFQHKIIKLIYTHSIFDYYNIVSFMKMTPLDTSKSCKAKDMPWTLMMIEPTFKINQGKLLKDKITELLQQHNYLPNDILQKILDRHNEIPIIVKKRRRPNDTE